VCDGGCVSSGGCRHRGTQTPPARWPRRPTAHTSRSRATAANWGKGVRSVDTMKHWYLQQWDSGMNTDAISRHWHWYWLALGHWYQDGYTFTHYWMNYSSLSAYTCIKPTIFPGFQPPNFTQVLLQPSSTHSWPKPHPPINKLAIVMALSWQRLSKGHCRKWHNEAESFMLSTDGYIWESVKTDSDAISQKCGTDMGTDLWHQYWHRCDQQYDTNDVITGSVTLTLILMWSAVWHW